MVLKAAVRKKVNKRQGWKEDHLAASHTDTDDGLYKIKITILTRHYYHFPKLTRVTLVIRLSVDV